jgi:hypothetical protein
VPVDGAFVHFKLKNSPRPSPGPCERMSHLRLSKSSQLRSLQRMWLWPLSRVSSSLVATRVSLLPPQNKPQDTWLVSAFLFFTIILKFLQCYFTLVAVQTLESSRCSSRSSNTVSYHILFPKFRLRLSRFKLVFRMMV